VVYFEDDEEITSHVGCPAYPNCDLSPLGCLEEMGDDVEWFGHKD
jgi:hypothetical protein